MNGPANSGRFTCAIRIGLSLLQTARRACFRYKPHPFSLEDILKKIPRFERNAVYIICNVSESNFTRDAFSEEYLGELNKRLAKQESILILTCNVEPKERRVFLEELQGHIGYVTTNARESSEFNFDVIKEHLEYCPREGDVFQDDEFWDQIKGHMNDKFIRDKLCTRLENPVQVSRYFRRLSQRRIRAEGEQVGAELEKLADEVTSTDRSVVKKWFRDEMKPNERLYALLIRLFDGLNGFAIHDLYTSAVRNLRAERERPEGAEVVRTKGLDLKDDREVGLEELRENMHVIARENGDVLEFDPPIYAREVDLQIDSYRPLLWTVMEGTVFDWICQYRAPQYWELRRLLGRAIGRLGIHEWGRLRQLLEKLACHAHGAIASVPGYALEVIIQRGGPHEDTNKLGYIPQMLREWVDSGDPDMMWATAAVIWRFYEALVEAAEGERSDEANQNGADDESGLAQQALRQIDELLEHLAVNFRNFKDGALNELCRTREQRGYPRELDLAAREENIAGWRETVDIWREKWATDISNGVNRAVCKTFRQRPKRAVDIACHWMRMPFEFLEVEDEERAKLEDPNFTDGDEEEEEEKDAAEPQRLKERDKELERSLLLQEYGAWIGIELLDEYKDPELLSQRFHKPLLQLVEPILKLAADTYETDDELLESYGFYQETVDSLLHIVRGWLRNGEWRDPVYETLLRALNRSLPTQRHRIARTLINVWLHDADETTHDIAEALLARVQIIDGAPIDMPGSQYGVLLIDGSAVSRDNNTGVDVGYRLYERLQQTHPDRAQIRQEDLNFVTLEENSYDLIISNSCMHHILNLEHVAYQVNRALTNDGFFFMEDTVGDS
ncbi:MAG: methyltransferase domain-containing protein, partial [Planctomycetes bacterium]|nr:methyltransferase domain-containing protein [Planctomycetota bacterium]